MANLDEKLKNESKTLCKYIDPSFYIRMFRKYEKEYFLYFKEYLIKFYSYAIQENPEVDFYISARRKSKFGSYKKWITKIKEHMDFISYPPEKKEAEFKYLFSFLDTSSDKKELVQQIKSISEEVTKEEKFKRISSIISILEEQYEINKTDVEFLYSLYEISDYYKREQSLKSFLFQLDTEMEKKVKDDVIFTFNTFTRSTLKEKFEKIYSLLTPEEQLKLTRRLGRTFDILAYRFIIKSVNFNVHKDTIKFEKDVFTGTTNFFVYDKYGKKFPIRPAQKIKSDNILQNNKGIFVILDEKDSTLRTINFNEITGQEVNTLIDSGKIEKINERNLLYGNIPATDSKKHIKRNRNLRTAQIDQDGCLTLLGDSIQFGDSFLNVYPDTFIEEENQIKVKTEKGYLPLNEFSDLILTKYDEDTTKEFLYYLDKSSEEYDHKLGMEVVEGRHKDYVAFPKEVGYMSIHNVIRNKIYKFFIERQTKTLLMEEDSESEESASNHKKYKNEKRKREISDEEKDFFNELLKDPDIELEELLPHFLLLTRVRTLDPNTYKMQKLIKTWEPKIDVVYEQLTGKSFNEFLKTHNIEDDIDEVNPDIIEEGYDFGGPSI